MMTRGILLAAMAAVLAAAPAGCTSKPSEEQCEKAVINIRKLTGQSHTDLGADRRATVRSCRAQSNRDTVECYLEAQTTQELYQCGGELAEAVRAAEEKKAAEKKKAGSQVESGSAAGAETGVESGPGAAAPSGSGAVPPTDPATTTGAGKGTESSAGSPSGAAPTKGTEGAGAEEGSESGTGSGW